MIIDARTTFETKHGRPLTSASAVANFLDELEVFKTVEIKEAIDQHGMPIGKSKLAMLVSKKQGDRVFTLRQSKDAGILATITRLK